MRNMRFTIGSTLLFLFSLSNTSAQLSSFRMGEIPFDSNTIEYQTGTIPSQTGTAHFEKDPFGAPNSAIYFNFGNLQYAPAPFASKDTSDFSIAFWFRAGSDLWPTAAIFSFSSFYSLRFNGFFDQLELMLHFSSDTSVALTAHMGDDSTWNHFAINVNRDSTLQFIKNNVLVDFVDISSWKDSTLHNLSGTLHVGDEDVALDDLIFFNTILDSSDINELLLGQLSNRLEPTLPSLEISPNPSHGIFNVEGIHANYRSINVFRSTGQAVEFEKKGLEIKLMNFTPGLHVLRIENGDGTIQKKMVMVQ